MMDDYGDDDIRMIIILLFVQTRHKHTYQELCCFGVA